MSRWQTEFLLYEKLTKNIPNYLSMKTTKERIVENYFGGLFKSQQPSR